MGKSSEKVTEKVTEEITKNSNILLQYAPILVGLICLVICYLLYKKIQTLNSQSESISNLEKQFTGFIKEQTEINTVNNRKFNGILSQINQLGYIIQNSKREPNTINTQMSPERDIEKQELKVQQELKVKQELKVQQESKEKEEEKKSKRSTTKENEYNILQEPPPPQNTSSKKENVIEIDTVKTNKNVINLSKDDTIIEEVSSDENDE